MLVAIMVIAFILTIGLGIWLILELRDWNKNFKKQKLLNATKPILHSSGKTFESYYDFTRWVDKNDLVLSEEIKKVKLIKK